jgi:hypothetical protein
MGPSLKILTLCILLGITIVLSVLGSMPDLPSSVVTNKMCLPAKKGHLVCDDTPQILQGYLNRVSVKVSEGMFCLSE